MCQLSRLTPAYSVDNTLPAHVTTISNAHGNYTTLAVLHVGQPQLYLIYPAGHAIACNSFALPAMLPAPRVLTRDVLVAAGFKDNGQLPLRDEALQQATTLATPHMQPATTLAASHASR